MSFPRAMMMKKRTTITAFLILGSLAVCARPASAQIAKIADDSGRNFFINANAVPAKLTATSKSHNIYLPAETSLTGRARAAMDVDRDGVEKLVREAADRHKMDPALVRAVIETESNWNATMATSTWRWRHTMRVKVQSTAPTEFLRSAKPAITSRRFRTRTFAQAQAACQTLILTGTLSTGTSHPKAASYLRTTEKGHKPSVLSFPFMT